MTMDNTMAPDERLTTAITLSREDYERLSALADAARTLMPDLADSLADEISRARVLDAGSYPAHIVCMNSEVEFRDDSNGKVQTVTLVYPQDADMSQGKLSILTPVGTALIGVQTGHSISWETPSGDVRRLTVLAVREPDTR